MHEKIVLITLARLIYIDNSLLYISALFPGEVDVDWLPDSLVVELNVLELNNVPGSA